MPRRGLSRWQWATVLLALLLASGGAYLAGSTRSQAQLAAAVESRDHPITVTADVGSCPLRDELTLAGVVRFPEGPLISVPGASASSSGAVVTRSPLKEGVVINNGSLLAEISGRPLLAIVGKFPAYRDLHPGDTGPDVRQLRKALTALYAAPGAGDALDAATIKALLRLYRSHGYDLQASATDVTTTPGTPANKVVSAAEFFVIPERLTVLEASAKVGGAPGTIARTTVGSPYIDVALTAKQSDQLHDLVGHTASARLGGDTAEVTLTEIVTPPTESADSGNATPQLPSGRFRLPQPRADLVGRLANVTLLLTQSPSDCIVVPISALWVGPGGQPRLHKADDVWVDVGVILVAGGQAAIRPAGSASVRPGDRVVIGYAVDRNPQGVPLG